MRTPFSPIEKEFSDRAHAAARAQLYPGIFNVPADALSFEDTQLGMSFADGFLDGRMAIDRIVSVKTTFFPSPLQVTVQERFRRKKWAYKRDVTITEYNPRSDTPSELHKLNANLFIYGYYDDEADVFVEAVAVDVLRMVKLLCAGKLEYKRSQNKRTGQTFITIKFEALCDTGCMVYHHEETVTVGEKEKETEKEVIRC